MGVAVDIGQLDSIIDCQSVLAWVDVRTPEDVSIQACNGGKSQQSEATVERCKNTREWPDDVDHQQRSTTEQQRTGFILLCHPQVHRHNPFGRSLTEFDDNSPGIPNQAKNKHSLLALEFIVIQQTRMSPNLQENLCNYQRGQVVITVPRVLDALHKGSQLSRR